MGLLALSISVFSCKKDNEEADTFSSDIQVAKDENIADNEGEDIAGIQEEIMSKNNVNFGRIVTSDTFNYENCAVVTIIRKTETSPGTVTVDFGSGCIGNDGRTRKGKIIWTYTDRYLNPGAVINTTFQDYGVKNQGASDFTMVDNTSTKTTTNTSATPPIQTGAIVNFTRVLDMKFKLPGSNVITQNGTKYLEWNLGELGIRYDNVYTLKVGSQIQGIDRKGRNYTKTVISNVVRKAECALSGFFKPVSGEVKIENENKTKIINFGDGNCDGDVSVTINGKIRKTRL